MEQIYDEILKTLGCILEPPPFNQLGMPSYYRHILAALSHIKEHIIRLEKQYTQQLKYWDDQMDEEF